MANRLYVVAVSMVTLFSVVLAGLPYLRANYLSFNLSRLLLMRKAAAQERDSLLRVENFDTTRLYTQPVCLQFQSKPLLTIGQTLEDLPANFHYTQIEGGHVGEPFLQYYLALRDDSVRVTWIGTDSIISPAVSELISFSTTERRKIFSLNAEWKISAALNFQEREYTIRKISAKFPCLRAKLDFDKHKTAVLEGKEYLEKFELTPPDSSEVPNWNFYYQVTLKPFAKTAVSGNSSRQKSFL